MARDVFREGIVRDIKFWNSYEKHGRDKDTRMISWFVRGKLKEVLYSYDHREIIRKNVLKGERKSRR